MDVTTEPGTRTRRTATVVGALVAAALGAAVVLAIVMRPGAYPPDSPEAAVQGYLQAALDGDGAVAATWLDPAIDCAPGFLDSGHLPEHVRITLEEVVISGDTARIDVRIAVDSDVDLFDPGYDFMERFRLRLTAEGWRISRAPWPYIPCSEVTP